MPGPRPVPTRARSRISRRRTPHSIAAAASSRGFSVPQAAGAAIRGCPSNRSRLKTTRCRSGLADDLGQFARAGDGLETGDDCRSSGWSSASRGANDSTSRTPASIQR